MVQPHPEDLEDEDEVDEEVVVAAVEAANVAGINAAVAAEDDSDDFVADHCSVSSRSSLGSLEITLTRPPKNASNVCRDRPKGSTPQPIITAARRRPLRRQQRTVKG